MVLLLSNYQVGVNYTLQRFVQFPRIKNKFYIKNAFLFEFSFFPILNKNWFSAILKNHIKIIKLIPVGPNKTGFDHLNIFI